MNITEYITSPWGVVCIGVLSSVFGTILFKIGVWFYKKTSDTDNR